MATTTGEPTSSGVSPDKVVTVLSVSDNHTALRGLFSHTKWTLFEADGCRNAVSFLERQPVPVVICDSELRDGCWKDVLRAIEMLPNPPLLIVTSRLADDRMWSEVLNLGGYDVLEKPFDGSEVYRVVSLAWLHWKNARRGCRAGIALP